MKWLDDLKARLKPKNTAEREKMKKYLVVFPLMFISCIASIWLNFAPGVKMMARQMAAPTPSFPMVLPKESRATR